MKLEFICPSANQLRTVVLLGEDFLIKNYLTLTHLLLCPKLFVEGVVVYGQENEREKMETLAELLGKQDVRIVRGSSEKLEEVRARESSEQNRSGTETPGARFLLERIKAGDKRPLHICVLGRLTDAALAYLAYPQMSENSVIVWSGSTGWPVGGFEENLSRDILAANELFRSRVPMWILPAGTYGNMRISRDEFAVKAAGWGEVGRFLWREARDYFEYAGACSIVFPGEAVVGAIINLFDHSYESIPAPRINRDMFFIHNEYNRPVRVYHFLDNRMILEDLFCKLKLLYGNG